MLLGSLPLMLDLLVKKKDPGSPWKLRRDHGGYHVRPQGKL
jgi:hypothetical protein